MKNLLFLLTFLTVQTFAQTTATVQLNGKIVSKAADVKSITVKWTVQSGTATIANPNELSTTATVPVGITVFALTGTDNFGSVSAPALKKVTVYRNNIPPVMDAGQDTTIQLGSSAFVPNRWQMDPGWSQNKLTNNGYTTTSVQYYKQGELTVKIEDVK